MLDLSVASLKNEDWITELCVGETKVPFKLDSGAQANILPLDTYKRIIPTMPIKDTRVTLSGFTNDVKVKPVGMVTYPCQSSQI